MSILLREMVNISNMSITDLLAKPVTLVETM